MIKSQVATSFKFSIVFTKNSKQAYTVIVEISLTIDRFYNIIGPIKALDILSVCLDTEIGRAHV